MAFYDDMATVADELLSDFGQNLTLTKTIPGAYDPVTGLDSSATTQSQTVVAAVLPFHSGKEKGADAEFSDAVIRGEVKKVLVSPKTPSDTALAFSPEPDHILTIDSVDWRVLGVTSLKPAGTVVSYSMVVQR